MKKFAAWATIAMVFTVFGANGFNGNSFGQDKRRELLGIPVKDLKMHAANIGLILSRLSDQYDVPVGFELATDDDLSITRTITIDVRDGTVKDVLNSIINQNPIYVWAIKDDVVNVFPRERNRDNLLKDVLETKLEKISVDKQTTRFTLKQTICENDAVMKILSLHDVKPANEAFGSRDFGRVGHDFSLVASNVSVATVLNRIIGNSQTKYWVIMRYGEKKQYLMLNF